MTALSRHTVRAAAVAVVAALVVTAVPIGVAAAPDATAASATTVTSCGTITEPGTYVLTADVTNSSDGSCLVVHADDVVVDGDGHAITGTNGTGPGILVENAERVTVQSVTLTDWRTGVAFRNVDGGAVANVTVTDASVTGLSLTGDTSDVTVEHANLTTGQTGVRLAGSGTGTAVLESTFSDLTTGVAVAADDTRVVDSHARDVATGVHVVGARSVVVSGNTLNRTVHGVVVERSGGVLVRDNVVRHPLSTGVRVAHGAAPDDPRRHLASPAAATFYGVNLLEPVEDVGHRVTNNTVLGGQDFGIQVVDSPDASVWANTVTNATDGIYLHETRDASVTRNVVTHTRDDGIVISNGADNALATNTVTESGDDGIYVVGNDNDVTNNSVTWSRDDGIDVHHGTDNRVVENFVKDNYDDGVFLRNAHETNVTDNRIVWNRDDGLDLRSSSRNVVTRNHFCANTDVFMVQRRGAENNDVWNNSVC